MIYDLCPNNWVQMNVYVSVIVECQIKCYSEAFGSVKLSWGQSKVEKHQI